MSRSNLSSHSKSQPWMYPSFVEARDPLAYRAGVQTGRAVKKAKPHLKHAVSAAKAAPAEIRTTAQDTVDTFKIQGVLTAIKALDTYDAAKPHIERKRNAARERAIDHIANGIDKGFRAKEKATSALEKLRYRRDKAADFITGRSMMARVVSIQEVKPEKVKEPHVSLRQVLGKPPKQPKERRTKPAPVVAPTPVFSPITREASRSRRSSLRTVGATAVALGALAALLASPDSSPSSAAQIVQVPEVATPDTPKRPATVMDSSLLGTWSAPRAEDRVIYNALPVPTINAVDYAARLEQAQAAAQQARYDQYEIERARTLAAATRVPYVSTPDQTSTYNAVIQAEMDDIRRIANTVAHEQAEKERYVAERAQRVGELQPGQQIGTIRLVQTGEAPGVGAPTGTRIVEHPVMVGMYDPSRIAGAVPTAQEIDQGANDTLDYGGVIQLFGGSVPGIDVEGSPYNTLPQVVTLHHLTPLNPAEGTSSTNPTEGLRWPEKTTIADPEAGIRGDTLIFTVGDELRIYEAIDQQIVDTKAPNHAEETRLIYGTEVYDASVFRVVTCYQSEEELSRATPGDIPAADDRFVTYFKQIGTLDLDNVSSMVPR